MKTGAANSKQGGCLCGAVRFTVLGAPIIVSHCHCKDCQHVSGTGHLSAATYWREHFQMTGETAAYHLTSNAGNKVTRIFCPICGSPILGRNTGMDTVVTVALGAFDDASAFVPQVAIFDRNRHPWDVMNDGLAVFAGQPDWKPENGA